MTAIRYRVTPFDPNAHLFEVALEIDNPDPSGQILELPVWIPGSYMIREFARHIVTIEATRGGRPVSIEKLDKCRWRVQGGKGPVALRYEVYAWDLSVRGAHLDSSHGFFNGTSVFLRVAGREDERCGLELVPPPAELGLDWRVATTLPSAGASPGAFGSYCAPDYDALIDHPVEMGQFSLTRFSAGGATHEIAITGRHDTDCERLARDLRRVCAAQARLFEPGTGRAPFDQYMFQVTAVGEGYGGLEHRNSTALITRRDDLPWPGMRGTPEGYRRFLGLCSHEYFHAWHVKRIKPQAFVRYALGSENYTRLLWIFEGFTSYYDDLMLTRAGVITQTEYLGSLAHTIGQVIKSPGRFRQSLAESSHDAWIKYYRQDENAPNAIVSYYAKGALLALCLDALIRTQTQGTASLDDVMRLLWQRYGRDFYDRDGHIGSAARGLPEDGFAEIVREATGLSVARILSRWVEGTGDLPLAQSLKELGIRMSLKSQDNAAARLGLRLSESGGRLRVTSVIQDGTANRAGVSAGDEIVAINGIRADLSLLNRRVTRTAPDHRIRAHLFRRDELVEVEIGVGRAEPSEATLSLIDEADEATRALREGWLSGR